MHRQGELIRGGAGTTRVTRAPEIDQSVLLAVIAKLVENGSIPALPGAGYAR
ncbi:MAG: hypothetical protein V4618_12100 [Pseudomonadota bacterium]